MGHRCCVAAVFFSLSQRKIEKNKPSVHLHSSIYPFIPSSIHSFRSFLGSCIHLDSTASKLYQPLAHRLTEISRRKTKPPRFRLPNLYVLQNQENMPKSTPLKTNMTLENPDVPQEIHLQMSNFKWWIFHRHLSFRGRYISKITF